MSRYHERETGGEDASREGNGRCELKSSNLMHSLIPPDISHKSRYLDMIEEWKNFETIPTSPANLFMGDTFEEFLLLCASKLFF